MVAVFKQANSAMKLFNFPSCFMDEIGSRFVFHVSYSSFKKLKKNFFFMY